MNGTKRTTGFDMRDNQKTPLQKIIDGDMVTPDGVYYARIAAITPLEVLPDVLQKAEYTLARKAKEARERGDIPDGDNLTSDRYIFSKAQHTFGMQHG